MRRGFCDEVLMPAYPIAQNLKSCSFIDWIEKMTNTSLLLQHRFILSCCKNGLIQAQEPLLQHPRLILAPLQSNSSCTNDPKGAIRETSSMTDLAQHTLEPLNISNPIFSTV
jgi:hypothetical protein